MIFPKARFYWPSPQPQDAESLDARSIYELYADDLIRKATGNLLFREDIFRGDRVEIMTEHLEYERKIDYLVFEIVAFDLGGECILEYRDISYFDEEDEIERLIDDLLY